MARVAGVYIPDKKQAWISLTHIFGIGRTTALKICETTGIKFDTKISALNEQELEKLRKEVGNFLVEGDLRREVSTNIKRLMDLGTLRGIRLRKRLPVFSERVWNDKPKKSFDEIFSTIERTDKILSLIIKDSRQDSILVGYNFKKDVCLWCDPNKEIE